MEPNDSYIVAQPEPEGLTVPAAPSGGRPSPLARRNKGLMIGCLVAVVVSVGGLGASSLVKSSAQAAAEAKPPKPTVLTAQVLETTLETSVVMRGSVSKGHEISFTPTSVAESNAGPGGSVLVVTRINVHPGGKVRAGDVVMEVSERPVFVLAGAFPAYRDLVPGESGRDIEELQKALIGLGFGDGDRVGYFGVSTQSAVRALYQRLGYPVALADRGFTARNPAVGGLPAPTTSASLKKKPTSALGPVIIVPASEVVFLPKLPARVAELDGGVGSSVSRPAVTFRTGGLSLTGKLDPRDAAAMTVGLKALILDEITGFAGSGIVTAIGKRVRSGSDDPYLPVTIETPKGWPAPLAGADVRVTIKQTASMGKVLAVPEAAITEKADGTSLVTTVTRDGSQRAVAVVAGVSADGMVEVTPAQDGTLQAGDDVVTGQ